MARVGAPGGAGGKIKLSQLGVLFKPVQIQANFAMYESVRCFPAASINL
jgi:hypothetical protein